MSRLAVLTIARRGRCLLATLALVAGFSGCGAGQRQGDGAVVTVVGGKAIASSALDHWMKALASGHVVPDPPRYTACIARRRALSGATSAAEARKSCELEYLEVRDRALGYLIASDWLAGEASALGMEISPEGVRRQLLARERAFPGGHGEFLTSMASIGHSLSDVEGEIRNREEAEKIQQRLAAGETPPTLDELRAYYKQHMARFEHAATRGFYIVENIQSRALAEETIGKIERGLSITKAGYTLHESHVRPNDMRHARTIIKAIFSAKPHVLTGPVKVEDLYFLVEVTGEKPAYVETFPQVRRQIETTLGHARHRARLARFIEGWRKRWTARTRCRAGYVIQKCANFNGNEVVEEPLSFT